MDPALALLYCSLVWAWAQAIWSRIACSATACNGHRSSDEDYNRGHISSSNTLIGCSTRSTSRSGRPLPFEFKVIGFPNPSCRSHHRDDTQPRRCAVHSLIHQDSQKDEHPFFGSNEPDNFTTTPGRSSFASNIAQSPGSTSCSTEHTGPFGIWRFLHHLKQFFEVPILDLKPNNIRFFISSGTTETT